MILTLSGCGGDSATTASEPTGGKIAPAAVVNAAAAPLPGASTLVVPPARVTTPPPPLPAAARQQTSAGAAAFARHFFDRYNHAIASADTEGLRPLASEYCYYCRAAVERVEALKQNRTHIQGGRILVISDQNSDTDPAQGILVTLLTTLEQGMTVRNTDGAVTATTNFVHRAKLDVAVRWEGSGWVMLDVQSKST